MTAETLHANDQGQEQKRDYYRLEYPLEFRPQVIYSGREFPVVNVSEYGVNFRVESSAEFTRGQTLAGEIVFFDQQRYSCQGRVIRIGTDNVVVHLSVPVPLHKIRSEHIFLIGRLAHKHD